MKALHYLRDHGYPNVEVGAMVNSYLDQYYECQLTSKKEQLLFFRHLAKSYRFSAMRHGFPSHQ